MINKNGKNLIIAMTLGDGCIYKKTLQIRHCAKQLDYLEWKRKLLFDNGIKVLEIKYFKNNNPQNRTQELDAYYFSTCSAKELIIFKKIFYKPKKIIGQRIILNRLDALGLAIWYMDDGHLSQKKRDGKVHANSLYINTYVSKEENQIIINYFKEKWNICFTQNHDKGFYRLRCGTKEARKFLDIVRPYVSQIPSMSHKLLIKESIHYKILN